ncbi:DinB family protein [Pedobacter soli]|uniref:DinB superfamily protein n=1 Tax=Pedobacter soli TaxID=390242 RepID=A0A1G6VBF7_9SPHI|nr:DinB family protein [Pedobacter soli]SDD51040.1 DinB superfamily protein [Pedobacter soli]
MEKVFKEAEGTLSALENLFSNFSAKQVNEVPFAGSWTAGQLANHLIMANGGFVEVINGPTTETSKPADIMVESIKNDFLNFNIKFDSPEFIYPENRDYNQEELLIKLKQIRNNVAEVITKLDLTKTCTAFELPVYGFLTRLEAIYFIIYHTQRHTQQLKNIYSRLDTADFN